MSVIPVQSNINSNKYFFTLVEGSTVNAGSISTAQITTSSIGAITANLSTADIVLLNNSTIYSNSVWVDGAELATVNGTELLLNGIPLATTANLSSIQDWSNYPAFSTVDMTNNNILSTNNLYANNINASNAMFTNLVAVNAMFVSTHTSTISSLSMMTDSLAVSSITEFGAAANESYITFNGGDITINSAQGGAGIFLTPTDEVLINGGVAVNYIRAVSSITDVSTINGQSYPPPGTGSTISTFATLSATQWISTPDLRVSSINGAELNGTTIIISSIQTQQVSSAVNNTNLSIVSSVQLRPSGSFSPNLNIDMGLGSLFTNVAGAALGGLNMVVGAVALATGVTAVALARQTKNTTTSTFEMVNTTTQLQISSLGQDVSSIIRYVSSINPETPGLEIFISTIIPAGTPVIRSFSDPMNTISSPSSTIQAFGQWVALPEQGVGGDFSTLTCSTLVARDLVSTGAIDVANTISTNGLSCGFAIANALMSTPQLYVSSVNGSPYPPSQQLLSTFPGNIYVGDSVFAQNQVSTTNLNVSNIISTNGLSCGYAIGSALMSTPQLFVSTIVGANINIPQNLNTSTIATNRISTSIVRAINISSLTLSTGTIIAGATSLASISTNLISTLAINGVSTAAMRTVGDFSSTILWSSLSTTFNPIVSTTLSTFANALVQVNYDTSILSLTNSYNDCQFYLTVGGVSSPIAYTSLPAGIGHYANGSMNFMAALSTGSYNVIGYMNCANNAAGTVVATSLSAIGNIRQG